MQQGEQQEQDAGEENRAAGQHDIKEGEHRASNQEHGPPAGPHSACEPQHPVGAGRCIQAPSFRREPPDSAEDLLVPCLLDNRLTVTGQGQISCSQRPSRRQEDSADCISFRHRPEHSGI
jgi:hypothetical protein